MNYYRKTNPIPLLITAMHLSLFSMLSFATLLRAQEQANDYNLRRVAPPGPSLSAETAPGSHLTKHCLGSRGISPSGESEELILRES
jgi:hypothetical protein